MLWAILTDTVFVQDIHLCAIWYVVYYLVNPPTALHQSISEFTALAIKEARLKASPPF